MVSSQPKSSEFDQVALLTETNNRLKKKLIQILKVLETSQKAKGGMGDN